jgi:hypothetical protein
MMNVPSLNSASARCSSAWVFIPIGPYRATGSSISLGHSLRRFAPQHVELVTKNQDFRLKSRSRPE